jgi:hypothetical protein
MPKSKSGDGLVKGGRPVGTGHNLRVDTNFLVATPRAGFLLPQGEGQDEGKKEWYFLLDALTLASSDFAKDKLSWWEREFWTTLCPTPKFVPNSIAFCPA